MILSQLPDNFIKIKKMLYIHDTAHAFCLAAQIMVTYSAEVVVALCNDCGFFSYVYHVDFA